VQKVQPFVDKQVLREGEYGSLQFKLFPTSDKGKALSPWHDIPLVVGASTSLSSNAHLSPTVDTLFSFIVEIPMYSTAKMEVMKNERGNPIMQDSKNGRPRYYTYGVPFFNYGLFPQTWEVRVNRIYTFSSLQSLFPP
jgi:3'-phosphoadenosine 5'-phosphosulfate synthase